VPPPPPRRPMLRRTRTASSSPGTGSPLTGREQAAGARPLPLGVARSGLSRHDRLRSSTDDASSWCGQVGEQPPPRQAEARSRPLPPPPRGEPRARCDRPPRAGGPSRHGCSQGVNDIRHI
jgi:hypothetical protein